MLQAVFEKHNSFLRSLKKKGLQGGKGDNNWVVRHRQIHDPGVQQEPLSAATPKFEAKRCGDSEHSSDCMDSITLKVRGGMISQTHRYLGCFCSSQRIFLPQIIQVLLDVSSGSYDASNFTGSAYHMPLSTLISKASWVGDVVFEFIRS